jgi:hypothetical protein
MKRGKIAAFVFLALGGLPLAVAQTPLPKADAPSADAKSGEAGRSLLPASRGADQDARRCLEFPTNAQIIMCAEKYRSNKRRE